LTTGVVKGVEELVNEFDKGGQGPGYLACLIAILYFGTVYGLEKIGSSTIWKPSVRTVLADYAYVVSSHINLTGMIGDGWLTQPVRNYILGWLFSLPW
jgi:hypothetical protein